MPRQKQLLPATPWRQHLNATFRVSVKVIAGAAILYVIWSIVIGTLAPRISGYSMQHEIVRLQQQVVEKRQENQKLKEWLAYAKSGPGSEEILRHRGMIKPGEQEVIIQPPPPKPATIPQQTTSLLTLPVSSALSETLGCFMLAFCCGMAWLLKRRQSAHAAPQDGKLTPRLDLTRRNRRKHILRGSRVEGPGF